MQFHLLCYYRMRPITVLENAYVFSYVLICLVTLVSGQGVAICPVAPGLLCVTV